MQIEHLNADRIPAVIELWDKVGLTRPWNDPGHDLRRALRGPSSTVLVGVEGDMIVASAMVGHDGHRGWLYYLATDPDHQRRGLGTELVAACESWLVNRGMPKVQLMVRGDNVAVIGFYRHLGYGEDDVRVLSRRLDHS
jgi:ribosomal protein S18 acetylase RimI-like enzyme